MIGHMRHGSPPRLLVLQSILSPNRRESLPTPSAGDRITGHAALRTTPLALRRLGQGSPAACGECGGPQRRAPECLAARQTASHHAALTPRPPDGRLTPTRRLRQRYHELAGLRRQPAPAWEPDGLVQR